VNVGKLKQLLEGLDDSVPVYIPFSHEFDGRFYSPCDEDSGENEIGGDGNMSAEDAERELNLGILKTEKVFLLLPCGFGDEETYHPHHILN
jgi:hypothetical protein